MCLKIEQMKKGKELTIPLGINEQGEKEFLDLYKTRHILVAGRSGSGKSTFLHKAIKHLTKNYSNEEVRLFLIDLEKKEFDRYKGLPNLKYSIANDWGGAVFGLYQLLDEMQRREEKFSLKSVFNIKDYNMQSPKEERLPYIFIIIDEAVELLQENDDSGQLLKWIAGKGCGVGIQLILATKLMKYERLFPSLKANLQTRVCFKTKSKKDSWYVLHEVDAKKLKRGEFLVRTPQEWELKKYKEEI